MDPRSATEVNRTLASTLASLRYVLPRAASFVAMSDPPTNAELAAALYWCGQILAVTKTDEHKFATAKIQSDITKELVTRGASTVPAHADSAAHAISDGVTNARNFVSSLHAGRSWKPSTLTAFAGVASTGAATSTVTATALRAVMATMQSEQADQGAQSMVETIRGAIRALDLAVAP